MGFGTLTKLLMGVGLGILTVSCLASTVVYGRFANSFTQLQKLEMKVSFDGLSEVHSTSIAIAVLGCLSAAAAIGAIVLTIFMENQTIVLIIVGGVSALFAFGCIVAEGIFTQKVVNYNAYNKEYASSDHKSAQKWIKEAIKDLYTQAASNINEKYKNDKEFQKLRKIPSFDSIDFGSQNSEKHIVTYSDFWENNNKENLTLHYSEGYIYGSYEKEYSSFVASTRFLYKEAYTSTQPVCWYNTDKTDLICKEYEVKKYTT